MRDGLYEMVRDAAAGHPGAEMRVEAARVLLEEAAELALGFAQEMTRPRAPMARGVSAFDGSRRGRSIGEAESRHPPGRQPPCPPTCRRGRHGRRVSS